MRARGAPVFYGTRRLLAEARLQGLGLLLFLGKPFNDTIAVVNLGTIGPANNEVFQAGTVTRVSSSELNMSVEFAPVVIDRMIPCGPAIRRFDEGADFYVGSRGKNTIVRMKQDGSIVAIRSVTVPPGPLNNVSLNGIATSSDGREIYITFTRPAVV